LAQAGKLVHLLLDGPDPREEFRRQFLGFGSPEEGGKFGYPFRERREENPQGPVILKVGEGLLNLLAGHSFPLVA
jgi:hypothetical protein